MNGLLTSALWLSLSGSVLMVLLFVCKQIFKARLSKIWQYYIWLVVIARLLLPIPQQFDFMGNVAVFINVPTAENATVEYLPDVSVEQHITVDESKFGNESTSDIPNVTQLDASGKITLDEAKTAILSNLWLIWLVVALILIIRKITIYQNFVSYIKAGRVEVSDIGLLEQFGRICEKAKLKRVVGVYTNSLVSSPLLIGFFKPFIVLPTIDYEDIDFRNTIIHELTHYRRFDMFYKWLVQFTVCVHWFNPLVYLMGHEINRACELACDEAVIAAMDECEQKAYGSTLINAMATGNYNQTLASLSLNESKKLIKERLDAIMRFKKKSLVVKCSALVLTIALILGFSATGTYAINPSNMPSPNLTTTKSVAFDVYNIKTHEVVQFGGYALQRGDKIHVTFENNADKIRIYMKSENITPSIEIELAHAKPYEITQSGVYTIAIQNNTEMDLAGMTKGTIQITYKTPQNARDERIQFTDRDIPTQSPSPTAIQKAGLDDYATVLSYYSRKTYTAASYKDFITDTSAITEFVDFTGSNILFALDFPQATTIDFSIKGNVDGEYKVALISGGNQVIKTASSYNWQNASRPIDMPKGMADVVLVGEKATGTCIVTIDMAQSLVPNGQGTVSKDAKEVIKPSDIDIFTMECIKTTLAWDTVELFLPYMTSNGVENLVNYVKKNSPGDYTRAFADTDKYLGKGAKTYTSEALTRSKIDEFALIRMNVSGNWQYVKPLFPYMTASGIEKVVNVFQNKTGNYNVAQEAAQYLPSNNNLMGWTFGDVPRCAIKNLVSENIVVKTGGSSFKIEVDAASKDSYTFTDGIHTTSKKREIDFERKAGLGANAVYSSTIYVTVPENARDLLMCFTTVSGDISVDGLHCTMLLAESESGSVNITNTIAGRIISNKYDDKNNTQPVQQQKYQDENATLSSIDIKANVVDLVLKESIDNTFSAQLTYPDSLSTWYDDAVLKMNTTNQTFGIDVVYADGEFDQTEGFDGTNAVLTVYAPKRAYERIKIQTFASEKPIIIPFSSKEVTLTNTVGNSVFYLAKSCDTLKVDNGVGNFTIYPSILPKTTTITSDIGDGWYYLPNDPTDIDVKVTNTKYTESAVLPKHWNYVVRRNANGKGDMTTYKRGVGENKVDVNLNVGRFYILAK